MAHAPSIVIITGATASGKSALALSLAEKTGGVIINADSQQVVRELRIVTARPSEAEEARAPHKLYGFLPAAEPCSVGIWLRYAKMEIDWALTSNRLPILVGGTGMYIQALTHGLVDIPDIPPAIRAQAQSDLTAMGGDAFHDRLSAIDPASAARIRPSDPQRLIRAYEVWLGTGKSLSWWKENAHKSHYNSELFTIFNVELERKNLYARIDARVHQMLAEGAEHEVRDFLALALPDTFPAMRIIGIPELGAYIAGQIPLETAIARMQQASRNYAKRQLTWCRNQLPDAIPIRCPDDTAAMMRRFSNG